MPGHGTTSLSLLQRVQTRDAVAWDRLVTLYRPLVCHWCRQGGVGPDDVDDVTQEVFLAVANGLGQFHHRGSGSFRAWLRGVTRHKLLDFHDRRGRQPAAAAGGTTAYQALQGVADPEPGSADDREETGGLYRRALELIRGEFEEKTWQAFWLTVIDGRSPTALAVELGVTPAAIRQAKSRVLRRLKQEIGDLID